MSYNVFRLKHSSHHDKVVKLNDAFNEKKRALNKFVDFFENTLLTTEFTFWNHLLEKFSDEAHWADHISELFYQDIFPFLIKGEEEFTVGDFRLVDHESVLVWAEKNTEFLVENKEEKIRSYRQFLEHLDEVSNGWFSRKGRHRTGKGIDITEFLEFKK